MRKDKKGEPKYFVTRGSGVYHVIHKEWKKILCGEEQPDVRVSQCAIKGSPSFHDKFYFEAPWGKRPCKRCVHASP